MKIYTNTFDLKQPTEKKFWVAPYSDFKIGIKVLGYNGTDIPYPPKNIELYKDGTKLTVDSNDGNMAYWKIKSEGTGEVEYTVKAKRNNKVVGELKLIQSVTDSTVYEQESGGEIPSDLEVDSINVDNVVDINGCGVFMNSGDFIYSSGCDSVHIGGCGITLNSHIYSETPIRLTIDGKITSPVIKQTMNNDDTGITLENNSVVNANSIPMIHMTGNYTGNQGCGALPYPNNFLYIENTYSQPVSFSVTNIDITAADAGGCTAIGTRTFDFKPTVITNIDGEKVIVLAAIV